MRRLTASLVLLGLAAAQPAAADTLPPRKPGLWESKTDAEGAAMTVKQCIDAKTDELAKSAVSGPGGAGSTCSKSTTTRTAAGYETETACKIGAISTEGRGLITGDFDSAIRMEMTTTLTGIPGQAQPMTRKTVIESRWLGPCEAGQKPGDIIMGDGKVIRTPGSR